MKATGGRLRITQIKSAIGKSKDQKRTIRALGLKKVNGWVEQDDRPEIWGMVRKVKHLVEVEEIKEARKVKGAKRKEK